jgi:hypothetical protein
MKALRKVRPYPELELEDASGNVYPLSFPHRLMQSVTGLGMPPINHWTTRSPYQAGETHWAYAFGPRVINMVLLLKGCDRTDYWDKRRTNIEMLMPSAGPHKLRLVTPDIKKYELHDVWVTGGYELSSDDNLGSPRVQIGQVQFTAYDPIWKWVNSPLGAGETRDANGRTCIVDDTWTLTAALVLPFTGPYLLGTTTGANTLTCVNDGTYATRPLITFEGPVEDWSISNSTNGDMLMWDGYTIQAGETVTVDIRDKTCTTNLGGTTTDVSTYLSGDTGSFALDPGSNTITVFASGGVVNAVTTVSICWYLEVLGV